MTYGQLRSQEAENRGIEKGIEKGIEIGLSKGIQQGKEEGMQVERLQTAMRMLRRGLAFSLIQELTGSYPR